MLANKLYYYLRPAIPRSVQIAIRQYIVELKLRRSSALWPIDPAAGKKPADWPGWPEGKKFALILTHDVDTAVGQENCIKLKDLEKHLGFRSSFNFVPERYPVSAEVLEILRESGFEIGVHGLNHDGKLFNSKRLFSERAARINHFLKEWRAVGFRAPAMHHNLEWMHELNIDYDASTFDTDPFEPQSDGVGSIFPFYVEGSGESKGYYELPYTLPQDFTAFILMKNNNIDIWKTKLDWIAECGGMALLNTHPDYMNFNGLPSRIEEYSYERYVEFFSYLEEQYHDDYCNLLPSELVSYLSTHNYVGRSVESLNA
jgi:peptidoglycan/xylan/chitin deacetylase (PgdA/CDA1 family)